MQENQEEENPNSKSSEKEKPWLEKQLEKLIGKQENMQPIIRWLFSLVGFAAGFSVCYWFTCKEKNRRIESLEKDITELVKKNGEQDSELKSVRKQLDENKEKAMRFETELKYLKDNFEHGRELNGSARLGRAGSFLH